MTPAEAVRAVLLTLSPVTALVNARVWTFRWPQAPTLPAVLVQQISDVEQPHLRGTDRLRWARVQVDVLAIDIAQARQVAAAIHGAYTSGSPASPTGLRGLVTSVGSPAFEIRQVLADGYREWWTPDDLKQARVTRDYRVWCMS